MVSALGSSVLDKETFEHTKRSLKDMMPLDACPTEIVQQFINGPLQLMDAYYRYFELEETHMDGAGVTISSLFDLKTIFSILFSLSYLCTILRSPGMTPEISCDLKVP